MTDPGQLFEQAVAAHEEDRLADAVSLFERAAELLAAERAVRETSDDRLMLELRARSAQLAAGLEPIPSRFSELGREQLALWDVALARLGVAEVGESRAVSLVSIGTTALLAGDVELAVEARRRLRVLLLNAEPPRDLPEDLLSAAATYVDARALDAGVDHRLGHARDGAATMREVVTLLRGWGGFPSEHLSTGERLLREANLVGRYVRLSLAGGDAGDVLSWLERYLALLESAHADAVSQGDEFVDGVAIRLLESAAELAVRCGRSDLRDHAVRLISAWTSDLAARGSVAGQVLWGDLPETLARVESFRP